MTELLLCYAICRFFERTKGEGKAHYILKEVSLTFSTGSGTDFVELTWLSALGMTKLDTQK